MQSIVGQNQMRFLSSQRTFIAIKIAIAENQAARPFPGLPKELNRKKIGDVKTTTVMDQKKEPIRFLVSAFSSSDDS